jgi:CheY-like chemotaxis protein
LTSLATGEGPEKGSFSICDAVKDAVEIALSGSAIKYGFRMDEDVRPVFCDPGQIRQMVLNLVLNSKEAMPKGGVIEIAAANVTLEPLEVPSLKPGKYVKLTIKDSGIGVSTEHLPRVFDPYFSTKQRGVQKGMGLGLSVAYAIAMHHEGHISMRSAPNIGTVVDIYLPASDKEPDVAKTYSALEAFANGEKALLMEDDALVRSIGRQLLQHLGCEVHAVSDGTEAVVLFKEAKNQGLPFTVVILDLTVRAGMGGRDTLRALSQIDPAVTAIATSGYSDDPVMANFAEYGFRGALAKPFQIEEVSALLQKVALEKTAGLHGKL